MPLPTEVSILVFLEVFPQRSFALAVFVRPGSFNPCFSGSLSSACTQAPQAQAPGWSVSILVFLEVFPQQLLQVAGAFAVLEFQSLFFWKSFLSQVGGGGQPCRLEVSILVFLEVFPQRNSEFSKGLNVAEFQSLFFWKSFLSLSAFWLGDD